MCLAPRSTQGESICPKAPKASAVARDVIVNAVHVMRIARGPVDPPARTLPRTRAVFSFVANDLTPHWLNIGPSLSIFTRFLADVSELFRSFDKSPLAKLAFFLGC